MTCFEYTRMHYEVTGNPHAVLANTNTVTEFHPFSHVALKLKPKIISQGELIVNLRKNGCVLFRMPHNKQTFDTGK